MAEVLFTDSYWPHFNGTNPEGKVIIRIFCLEIELILKFYFTILFEMRTFSN